MLSCLLRADSASDRLKKASSGGGPFSATVGRPDSASVLSTSSLPTAPWSASPSITRSPRCPAE